MTAYYNEHDPFAATWLRNLIAAIFITAFLEANHEIRQRPAARGEQ
jgi:hypothetical protein